MEKTVLIDSKNGGTLLIGQANGVPHYITGTTNPEMRIYLKFVKGSKVVHGWFDIDGLMNKTVVACRDSYGGEVLIDSVDGTNANGDPEIYIHMKFIQGSKVIDGWFDVDEFTGAIQAAKQKEARRLGWTT
jgi:glutaredoxin-related protein